MIECKKLVFEYRRDTEEFVVSAHTLTKDKQGEFVAIARDAQYAALFAAAPEMLYCIKRLLCEGRSKEAVKMAQEVIDRATSTDALTRKSMGG